MRIAQLVTYSRENRTMTIAFNNAAYRYLFATLRGVLYKNKGTNILTPSMHTKIRNCLAMFAIIYVLCRANKHILKYKFFSPISSSKPTIAEYKKVLMDCGMIFVDNKTFSKNQTFDGSKDDPEFITESFTDDNWDQINFANLDESIFDFLDNPDEEDKRRESK